VVILSREGVRKHTLISTFNATQEEADEIKRVAEIAINAFIEPTEEKAHALFELGAAAIVAAAQEQDAQ
jgi:hypothetical protein